MKKYKISIIMILLIVLVFSSIIYSASFKEITLELLKKDITTTKREEIQSVIVNATKSGVSSDLLHKVIKNNEVKTIEKIITKVSSLLKNGISSDKINKLLKNNKILEIDSQKIVKENIEQNNIYYIDLVDLKKNSIKFKILRNKVKSENETLSYEIEGQGINKKVLIDEINSTYEINNLKENTTYTLTLKTKNNDEYFDRVAFKTFANIKKGYQLFYYLNASKPENHNLDVKIFGQLEGLKEMNIIKKGYHSDKGISIIENSLNITNGILKDDEKLRININNKKYFTVSYKVDKSYFDTGNHGAQGYLGKNYLLLSGEQALILPENNIDYQIENLSTVDIKAFLNIQTHWEQSVGFEVENDVINLLSHKKNKREEGLLAGNIYAYNKYNFRKKVETIKGVDVELIFEDSISTKYMDDVLNIYRVMAEKWGSGNGDDKYTIMIVDDYRKLYAGEWTTGQGFSRSFGITGEMVAHQIYHIWNAWELGVRWNHSNKNWGLWNEGFNEYYCDKVRTELGIIDHDDLKGYYRWYENIRGTSQDVPILEYKEDEDDWRIIYQKGALLAYLLDEKIQEETGGKHSLDDLLKYAWERWDEKGKKMDYHVMKDYIKNDLGVKDLDNWWQKYIIDNKGIHISNL